MLGQLRRRARSGQPILLMAVIALPLYLLPSAYFPDFMGNILIYACIFGILALSCDILSGYTGQISFGHAGLFAVGAYSAALLTLNLNMPPLLSTSFAIVITALFGLCIGYPALRVRGPYLALITLGFSELIRVVIKNLPHITGGMMGLRGYATFGVLPDDPSLAVRYMYYIILSVFLLCAIGLYWLAERTRVGKAFKAIREDEILAMALGINITLYKLLAFVISAGVAGLAGSLYAFQIRILAPTIAGTYITTLVIAMVLVGGSGTIVGPFVGALVLYNASEYSAFIGPVYKQIAIGVMLILFVTFLPQGLVRLGSGNSSGGSLLRWRWWSRKRRDRSWSTRPPTE